ncbi:MAG TPA: phosphopantetheine-binding protein [Methylomirabilota bacterium]|jgi:acyl carrier protein|nr:phosphopantetheine-binding protein [Methylomirabilota bacterium]
MQPDTTKIWTPSEIRVTVGKILVESLGVDEATVTDEASLVRDLGAESIDFLDISFKCQQTFGVDLAARLLQDRLLEWRDLRVLAQLLGERTGLAVPAEEFRTIAPSTIAAVLRHLETRHGLVRKDGDEQALARALAERLLRELDGVGLDLSALDAGRLAGQLTENLHSPAVMTEVMNRFTVAALSAYLAAQLMKGSRLASGA